jgi:hypothetical protein
MNKCVCLEYRRLLGKILVLPGFEFTATFGFHIIRIIRCRISRSREIEHLSAGSEHIPPDSAG